MNTLQRGAILVAGLVTAALATGCSSMSDCQKGTAVGAGVGGVAGSVLSGGSTAGTVGGAVVGGVLGAGGRCS
ncbi:MAG: glycine zipper 2TM domain-containing protein [Aquincola tertiaricarbonis]|uniref:glycine zipper 2TM domain-containing protein n=1 Tax=Aquincola TaxID=391952 RepID=UPI000614E8EF|nr:MULTISPECIES: glycine zipper 2TM domain-containing protein [Aquincola]MCR5864414.1 glycine zipper 2TM domain-containing protein [Aquincola sp. J276]